MIIRNLILLSVFFTVPLQALENNKDFRIESSKNNFNKVLDLLNDCIKDSTLAKIKNMSIDERQNHINKYITKYDSISNYNDFSYPSRYRKQTVYHQLYAYHILPHKIDYFHDRGIVSLLRPYEPETRNYLNEILYYTLFSDMVIIGKVKKKKHRKDGRFPTILEIEILDCLRDDYGTCSKSNKIYIPCDNGPDVSISSYLEYEKGDKCLFFLSKFVYLSMLQEYNSTSNKKYNNPLNYSSQWGKHIVGKRFIYSSKRAYQSGSIEEIISEIKKFVKELDLQNF